jgi:hypothetical protein
MLKLKIRWLNVKSLNVNVEGKRMNSPDQELITSLLYYRKQELTLVGSDVQTLLMK